MKKTLFVVAAALVSATAFAQVANVKKAKSILSGETPDFATARTLINEAKNNEETKNDANTYLVAGLIGFTEADKMNMNQMLGQSIDEMAKGGAVLEAFDNFVQADKMGYVQLVKKGVPQVNKKTGEPVMDMTYRKQIAPKMQELYNRQDLIKFGIALNDNKDYQGAYEAFARHLSIPEMDMFDAKAKAKMPKDTTYQQYKYYAALFAVQAEMHEPAIAMLEELRNGEYEPMVCAQFLYQEYVNVKDTDNFVRVLKESMVKYPSEPWFLQNLINFYIFSNQETAAINYLNEAIALDPTVAQYYLIRGNLNENQGNYDAALADFATALEKDPTMADAEAGKGRVFYNQAVKINEESAYLDGKEYKAAEAKMKQLFQESLPYFEKAHQMEPTNRDYMITLKTLYYRFEMEAQYKAIQAELDAL